MSIDSNDDDSIDPHPETMGDCPMCDFANRLIKLATKGEPTGHQHTPQELIDKLLDL